MYYNSPAPSRLAYRSTLVGNPTTRAAVAILLHFEHGCGRKAGATARELVVAARLQGGLLAGRGQPQ